MLKKSSIKFKNQENYKINKKISLIILSFILLGCSSNYQRIPAPITNTNIQKKEPSVKPKATLKKIPLETFALSPIWSANGKLSPKKFTQIPGWSEEDFSMVWDAWKKNCHAMSLKDAKFNKICSKSEKINPTRQLEIKEFFEKNFQPFKIMSPPNTITGYYEPILKGSLNKTNRFSYPLHSRPADLIIKKMPKTSGQKQNWFHGKKIKNMYGDKLVPYPSRKELYLSKYLKNFEMVYLENPIDVFFMQIQGSGRIELDNGQVMRLGFSASNGHPYRSIGNWLIKEGEMEPSSASMQGIKNWLKENPTRLNELLFQNPRMIFFKNLTNSINSDDGPIGSLGVPLTPGRSIAIDTKYVALGLPVFLSTKLPKFKKGISNGNRLVFAQDTGKAIKGPNRGDLFFGSGYKAGSQAGSMKYSGTMTIMIPKLDSF
ncbi:MAG: hypothetical protein CBD16_08975 [Betaproteobacteria bacterium TMED156]|nr:MAG: hypothetical protein CBD16_08975 [Betaproteobacteria bacterium TMED156]